jgi:hypothetical protein
MFVALNPCAIISAPQITNYGDLAKCIRKATKATKAKHEEKENA